jgi:DNA-directed RNA polymerase specialized sigma24 family protein
LDVTARTSIVSETTGDYPARSVAIGCEQYRRQAMPAGDRPPERRRAAALARHYRDAEGLSIRKISRRLGRAEATVKAYLYDPTGEEARDVKRR